MNGGKSSWTCGRNWSWLVMLTFLILCISSRYCLCVSKCTLLQQLCIFFVLFFLFVLFVLTTQTVLMVKNFETGWNLHKVTFRPYFMCLECANRLRKETCTYISWFSIRKKTPSLHWELLRWMCFYLKEKKEKEMKDNPMLFLLACLWKCNEISRTSQSPGTICLC